MARYADTTDIIDPALRASEAHMLAADALVDADLRAIGVDPADPSLPSPLLTQLAVAYACQQAALEQSRGEETALLNKAALYAARAKAVAAKLTRDALGLATPALGGAGLGSIRVGRG